CLGMGASRGLVFFFSSRRRHTRSKRDWSSDVCSSDLKLDSVNEHRRDLIQDKEILESKVERLEVENSSLEDKLTVANSKLLEKEYDLSKMPEIEFKGRLVIDRLEKGYEPKNKK